MVRLLTYGFWLVIGLAVAFAPQSGIAQSYNNTIFFGDSNTDNGRYATVPQTAGGATDVTGIFTTPNGSMWSVVLARKFGFSVSPNVSTATGTQIAAQVGASNNYAAGNAHVAIDGNSRIGTNAWSTAQQLASYLGTSGQRADPNALYIYYIGTNDLKSNYIVNLLTPSGTSLGAGYLGDLVDGVNYINRTTAIPAASYNPGAMNVAGLTTLASQALGQVVALRNAGARSIIVPNITSATKSVAAVVGQPWTQMAEDSRNYYNQLLWGKLAGAKIAFIPADFSGVQNYVALNAATFGFTHTLISAPACGTVASYNCTLADLKPDPNSYIFADTIGHLSAAGQQLEADYVYALLTGPSEISQLATAALMTTLSTVDVVRSQAFVPWTGEVGELRPWVRASGGVMNLSAPGRGFSGSSADQAAGSAGFDLRVAPEWRIGLAVTGSLVDGRYGLGGGYTQVGTSLSPYGLFQGELFWASAVVSAGTTRNVTKRQIPLGITSQTNRGTVSGTDMALALQMGKDFQSLIDDDITLIHGPILGFVSQGAAINGFSESNGSGAPITLHYGSQHVTSNVSQLGYRASMTVGDVTPTLEVAWNHEWNGAGRQITTSLLSTTGPSYEMPAVVTGQDWAAVTATITKPVATGMQAFIAFNGRLGQARSQSYAVVLGVNAAFK